MNNSFEFIFLTTLIVTLFAGAISYLLFKKYGDKELSNLTEFWASLAVNEIIFFLLRNGGPMVIAFSMVGWLWSMKTFRLVLQDISGKRHWARWEYVVIAVGVFLGLALGSYRNPFLYVTLPLAIAVGVVGLFVTVKTYREVPRNLMTPLAQIIFTFMALLFIERLTFPLWRLNPEVNFYGFLLNTFVLLGLAITTISSYLEKMSSRHEEAMKQLVKEQKDKLLSSSKYSELGMMSAGIAHEINNPLAVIQARTTQLLRIYGSADEQKDLTEGLQQILYTSERINRTIQGVREFVHQDEKKTEFIEIGLKELIDDVMAFTGQRLKNHGVNIRFYGLDEFSVYGNKIQLEQIILNLLNNSLDAIEFLPDKWIEMSAVQDLEAIQIYFKDSGHGIPPEVASHMMDAFFSTKEVGKGTGLGLALAKGIAEKHGGRLIYIDEGPHTTFLLELPRWNLNSEWEMALH